MARTARPRGLRTLGVAILVILAVVIVFSSYTIIGPGQRGVVIFLGNVETGNVLDEGFHLVIPPIARQVVPMDVRTAKLELIVDSASRDLQSMTVTGVLNYHVNPEQAALLYQQVGLDYENIIVVPAMHEAIKAATALYRVEDVLSRRAELKNAIQDTLTTRLAETYITVDQFSFANVEFSAEFNQAIEQKQVAEQAALQKEYELQAAQKDIEIAIARAEADKEAAIKAAEGRAQARQIEAEAEAAALGLIAAQLRSNPALIQYEWATSLAPGVSTVLLPSDQGIILDAGSLVP
eukprot:GDKH01016236.1.p1 GENE.GDKH01016236.1~~GDKH01016236.1.p1  ORF type:complete len:318 (-),score=121.59 GDKH01016236.1:1038-1919(-)